MIGNAINRLLFTSKPHYYHYLLCVEAYHNEHYGSLNSAPLPIVEKHKKKSGCKSREGVPFQALFREE